MDLYLFRIKVVRPGEQAELFLRETSNENLVREVLLSRPTARTYRGQAWHVGNVQEIDGHGLYFALGRTGRSTQPILDPSSGNFIETQFDTAPYTHALLDARIEVVAIARKTSLAPDAAALAHQLERTLGNAALSKETGISFTVAPISDPEAFLNALRAAYSIKVFTISFTKPNPLDVNQLFLAPMERLAQEADALSGSATLRGESLNEQPLEDLTRSAASTGDDARARLQVEEGQRPVTRNLAGDTVSITQDDLESPEGRASGLAKLRNEYDRIRGEGSSETP